MLQRYCDSNTPFNPLPQFDGEFKRSTNFYNSVTGAISSLFGSAFSSGFALIRGRLAAWSWGRCANAGADMAAVCQLDKVSTNEIEQITRQLSQPLHSAGFCP